jgi:hypothetical protein
VDVLHRRQVVGLGLAAVDDDDVVPGGDQLGDDCPPDEPRAAEDGNPAQSVGSW